MRWNPWIEGLRDYPGDEDGGSACDNVVGVGNLRLMRELSSSAFNLVGDCLTISRDQTHFAFTLGLMTEQ
jgi:hypothetical protein